MGSTGLVIIISPILHRVQICHSTCSRVIDHIRSIKQARFFVEACHHIPTALSSLNLPFGTFLRIRFSQVVLYRHLYFQLSPWPHNLPWSDLALPAHLELIPCFSFFQIPSLVLTPSPSSTQIKLKPVICLDLAWSWSISLNSLVSSPVTHFSPLCSVFISHWPRLPSLQAIQA